MKIKYELWQKARKSDSEEVSLVLLALINQIYAGHTERKGELSGSGLVFDTIQKFLEYSFWMGYDPTIHLNESCTDFKWKIIDVTDDTGNLSERWCEKLMLELKNSDFFWPIPYTSIPNRWVTARANSCLNLEPKSLCGCMANDMVSELNGLPDNFIQFIATAQRNALKLVQEAFQREFLEGKFNLT
jgi:hypothetical protein